MKTHKSKDIIQIELNKKLQKIDNFFDSITSEEFDLILEKNGIKDIKSSNECDMHLHTSEQHKNI